MSALASNWAVHLAHALWQATVAGLVILALIRLPFLSSPRVRHLLVSLALLKFVLPPMLPLPTGLFSAAPPLPAIGVVRELAQVDTRILATLMFVHLGGIAISLARLAAGAWNVRRIVRAAEPANGFLLSDDVAVPMTTGRAIVIPRALHATLSAEDLETILEHEREHQRRGDVRTSILQSLVAALWWFHPLVHLLVREARTLREERCDDGVIGRIDPAAYARTLLRSAARVIPSASEGPGGLGWRAGLPARSLAHARDDRGGQTPTTAAIAESEHALLRRIRRMAAARYSPGNRTGLLAFLLVLLVVLVLLPGIRVSSANRIAFDHATRHALFH